MSFYSIRLLAPTAGKTVLATERIRALGSIYARHGAMIRVGRVVAGDAAGQLYLGTGFADGKSLAQVFEKVQADPAFAKLREERELNPAGSVTGPEVFRVVHGQVEPGYPVVLMREYAVAREKLAGIVALMPELDALGKRHDIKILGAVPVFSSDMGRMIAGYYYRSPAHLGDALDGVGASAEFAAIVTKAAGFGSLTRSRVVMSM